MAETQKYIAYYRVSTKKQGYGLEAQRKDVSRYTAGRGEVIDEYQEKESGKNDVRPAFHQALEKARESGATLVIAKLDRLSRNVGFIFALRDSEVNFVACDIPDANTMTVGIMAVMAQHEREIISERTKAGLAVAKANGRIGGNPDGFNDLARERQKAVQKEKALMNDNNKRAKGTVELLLKEGKSLRQIADWLNHIGEKTSKGKQHTATSVSRLIKLYDLKKEVEK